MDGVITADHSLNELYDWYFQYKKQGAGSWAFVVALLSNLMATLRYLL